MLLRISVLLSFLLISSANAADIKAIPLNGPGEGAIFIEGDLTYQDREDFLTKINPFARGLVIFNSKGGSAYAGIEIGKTIRMRGFTTWVPSGSSCASACAVAWLGGTRRLVGKSAVIGFHSVYKIENGAPVATGDGNAIYGAYLSQLGLSDRAIMYLSNAAPTSMNWLTPAEAESFGISLTVYDPKPTEPPAPANPPGDTVSTLETRARDFVIALNVLTSGPDQQYFNILDGIYSDQVVYFGKQISRAEVVDQINKFIVRWPIRSYVARPSSLNVQCNNETSACRVEGIVDFSAKSFARKQWSHGVAAFDYLLSFRPNSRWPVIVNENGGVVNRQIDALQTVDPPYSLSLGAAR